MSELLNQAKALAPEIVRWRRHIHENPEVSAVLPNTCAYVTAELRKMGYEPYEVGGGVVAMLDGAAGWQSDPAACRYGRASHGGGVRRAFCKQESPCGAHLWT